MVQTLKMQELAEKMKEVVTLESFDEATSSPKTVDTSPSSNPVYKPSSKKIEKVRLSKEDVEKAIRIVTPFGPSNKSFLDVELEDVVGRVLKFSSDQLYRMSEEAKDEITNKLLKDCRLHLVEARNQWLDRPYFNSLENCFVTTRSDYDENKLRYAVEAPGEIFVLEQIHFSVLENSFLITMEQTLAVKLKRIICEDEIIEEFLVSALGVVPFAGAGLQIVGNHYERKLKEGFSAVDVNRYKSFLMNPFALRIHSDQEPKHIMNFAKHFRESLKILKEEEIEVVGNLALESYQRITEHNQAVQKGVADNNKAYALIHDRELVKALPEMAKLLKEM